MSANGAEITDAHEVRQRIAAALGVRPEGVRVEITATSDPSGLKYTVIEASVEVVT